MDRLCQEKSKEGKWNGLKKISNFEIPKTNLDCFRDQISKKTIYNLITNNSIINPQLRWGQVNLIINNSIINNQE